MAGVWSTLALLSRPDGDPKALLCVAKSTQDTIPGQFAALSQQGRTITSVLKEAQQLVQVCVWLPSCDWLILLPPLL
jgi:hypothetical protein